MEGDFWLRLARESLNSWWMTFILSSKAMAADDIVRFVSLNYSILVFMVEMAIFWWYLLLRSNLILIYS